MKQKRQICVYVPELTATSAVPARVYLGLLHTSWTIVDFRYLLGGTCGAVTEDYSILQLKRYYNDTTVTILWANFKTPSTNLWLPGYLERGAGADAQAHDPYFDSSSDQQMWAYWEHYFVLTPAAAAGTMTVSFTAHLNLEREV
ncbi:MAG: hypothetical protein BWY63_03149 [Chloroflexi bacterium ADurb.Bin360]|nr:MAG: hypothetical protein BWY63_03149 [Chloroflexi bacterium ADurb.Bin360]